MSNRMLAVVWKRNNKTRNAEFKAQLNEFKRQSKRRQDIEKLESAIEELEKLDINSELANHEALQNWNELNNKKTALNKEKSTLESALLRADKSVEKAEKDIANLDDATCYTPHSKLAALKTRRTTGKKCFVCLTRVVGRNAAVNAEMGVTIGLTCESFSQKAFELIS